MECQYELMTFGIPTQLLPISVTGEECTEQHNDWLRGRREKESFIPQLSLRDAIDGDLQNSDSTELIDCFDDAFSDLSDIESDEAIALDACPSLMSMPEATSSNSDILEASTSAPKKKDLRATKAAMSKPPTRKAKPKTKTKKAKGKKTKGGDANNANGEVVLVMVPNHHDVLFVRGNLNHYGNLRFRQIVDGRREEYDSARKSIKTQIAQSIVDEIKGSGGRFLKRHNEKGGGDSGGKGGCWVVISDDEARYKVCHRFRNIRILENTQGTGGTAFVPSSARGGVLAPSAVTSNGGCLSSGKKRGNLQLWGNDTAGACF